MAKKQQSGDVTNRKVSKSLQETVAANPHIDFIHFDAEGNHHFNIHKFEGAGKDSENNGHYARIHNTKLIDSKTNVQKEVRTPILNSKIVESVSREAILNAEAESDLLNMSLIGLTDAEKKVIAKMRSGE